MSGIDTLAERLAQVDADTLFDELAARLERIVPFEASRFFGTDPSTLLATFPARIDGIANNHCHAYWQRELLVEDANLFRDLARAPIPANTLWAATDNLPARSARYREFLRPERFGRPSMGSRRARSPSPRPRERRPTPAKRRSHG